MVGTRLSQMGIGKPERNGGKQEFVEFVRKQFRQLVKKNLSIPVTLYHL